MTTSVLMVYCAARTISSALNVRVSKKPKHVPLSSSRASTVLCIMYRYSYNKTTCRNLCVPNRLVSFVIGGAVEDRKSGLTISVEF